MTFRGGVGILRTTSTALSSAVVTHTLLRRGRRADDRFPLTGGWFQKISRELGCPVGEHRALREIKQLVAVGVLVPAGSYRQAYSVRTPSGWHVRLYRLGAPLKRRASIRRPKPVKAWWHHPLFGERGVRPRYLSKRLQAWAEPPPWFSR